MNVNKELEIYRDALKAILEKDMLFEANPEAFDKFAFKRCQDIAKYALEAGQKERENSNEHS